MRHKRRCGGKDLPTPLLSDTSPRWAGCPGREVPARQVCGFVQGERITWNELIWL